jgi:hypothetical protein
MPFIVAVKYSLWDGKGLGFLLDELDSTVTDVSSAGCPVVNAIAIGAHCGEESSVWCAADFIGYFAM